MKTPKQKLKAAQETAHRAAIQAWLRKEKLPSCEFEYVFAAPRKWRFDLCWVDAQVALEIEGNIHHKSRHTTGTGMLGDMDKYNTATACGWRVFRVARPPQAEKWGSVLYSPQVAAWLRGLLT